ncbi:DNA repair protein [Thioclava dalianensis]|uniref:DNA repair protein n=1 Tax=Thioclava dalianensis TaxID=1185766 RepID=A0A074THX4_9RHOB|nr:DNA repair protein [Thioclava dalianensis]KEP71229.1 DNA repair protein [Thioclava dalianensis]SFM74876.1 hypothetical protein SAMN05216224_101129 [Thioclava dalianensis]
MANDLGGTAAVSRIYALTGQALNALVLLCALAALCWIGAALLGLAPWLEIDARLGDLPVPNFGIWLQGGVAALALILLLYLPSASRVSRLEGSHRNFKISMTDVAQAYRAAHDSDRSASFALSGEFDAMRERMEYLRRHPELGDLEPELLELAAQMSLQSRDLSRIYSDQKVSRARTFLKQRQQETDRLAEQIALARRTCDELREWITDVEVEERKVSAELKLLERDLRDILPALGYELEDGTQPNVVPMPKK